MLTSSEKKKLYLLLEGLGENTLSNEQFNRLDAWLRTENEAREIYLHYMQMWADLPYLRELLHAQIYPSTPSLETMLKNESAASGSLSDSEIWAALLEAERTAPGIARVPPPAEPTDAPPKKAQKKPEKISKLWPTIATVSSIAALFLVAVGFVHHLLQNRVIATLGESVHAVWTEAPESNELGRGEFYLEEGYAQIIFKQGAEVVLQAPCAFELHSPQRMACQSGTVTATVPEQAVGFLIETPSSSIVDYGTAFGVFVDAEEQCDIHVFEGEVGVRSPGMAAPSMLKAGENALTNLLAGVQIGKARRAKHQYQRQVPDATRIGIPGKQLSLADLVGGGNGYGTGVLDIGIDPATGQWLPISAPVDILEDSSARYAPMLNTPAIDGVFVPHGQKEVLVSSTGLLFDACPPTTGRYFGGIYNGAKMVVFSDKEGPASHQGQLDGVLYGTLEHPAINMHANAGITFDLAQIRQDNPGVKIQAFTGRCGISDTADDYDTVEDKTKAQMTFWVLVDGRAMGQHSCSAAQRTTKTFDIPFGPAARFLTLTTTANEKGFLWGFFAEPILKLKTTK